VIRLSVWTVRTAMLYLAIGFLLGALMLFQKGVPVEGAWLRLLPLHIEFVLMGWTLQLAMGVAFWILPRFSREPRYGQQRLGWIAYALLNLGVLSAGLGQWLQTQPLIPTLGRGLEILAVISFALHAWPRIKPAGA
jgi:cbb3-type cytochrome oxidase subunit 1